MRSDVVDGVTVDRGFQLLNPAYPEAARVLDLDALALRPFTAGVLLAGADGRRPVVADPRRTPSALASTVRTTPGSRLEQLRFAAYAAGVGYLPISRIKRRRRRPPSGRRCGRSARSPSEFSRPSSSGVLFDDSRTTSRRFVELRAAVVRPRHAVGAGGGDGRDPAAARARRSTCGCRRRCVLSHRRRSPSTDGSVLPARAVIVATDAGAAAALLPGLQVPTMNAGTTWWHLADVPGSALAQRTSRAAGRP